MLEVELTFCTVNVGLHAGRSGSWALVECLGACEKANFQAKLNSVCRRRVRAQGCALGASRSQVPNAQLQGAVAVLHPENNGVQNLPNLQTP